MGFFVWFISSHSHAPEMCVDAGRSLLVLLWRVYRESERADVAGDLEPWTCTALVAVTE